ncbi:MAG TPA: hypothetical protein VJT31_35065 [Rugosimonospora sp.]|nr:hypothetical protein [Rugosimonospora sp.]
MASADRPGTTDQTFATTLDATAAAERIEAGSMTTVTDLTVLAQSLLAIAEEAMPATNVASDSRCRLARAVLAREQLDIRSGWVDLHALDPEMLVETLHPEGELTADHTTEAAFQARELLRYLTQAVQAAGVHRSLPDPDTTGTVIGLSAHMTTQLRLLLEALATRTRRLAEDPRITLDATGRQHGGPDTVADLAGINLEHAAGKLGEADLLLRTAGSYTDTMTFHQPDDAQGHDHG